VYDEYPFGVAYPINLNGYTYGFYKNIKYFFFVTVAHHNIVMMIISP